MHACRKDTLKHVQKLAADTCAGGALCGVLKVPDAAGNIMVEVFLSSRCVRYSLAVAAPNKGFQATRVKWLAKQLRGLSEMPAALRVTAHWNSKGVLSESLARDIAEDATLLLVDKQKVPVSKTLMPRQFILQWTTPLAKCKGRSSSPVLDGITRGLEDFYRKVVEEMVAYVPKAPRMPEEEEASIECERDDFTVVEIEQQALGDEIAEAVASESVPVDGPALHGSPEQAERARANE